MSGLLSYLCIYFLPQDTTFHPKCHILHPFFVRCREDETSLQFSSFSRISFHWVHFHFDFRNFNIIFIFLFSWIVTFSYNNFLNFCLDILSIITWLNCCRAKCFFSLCGNMFCGYKSGWYIGGRTYTFIGRINICSFLSVRYIMSIFKKKIKITTILKAEKSEQFSCMYKQIIYNSKITWHLFNLPPFSIFWLWLNVILVTLFVFIDWISCWNQINITINCSQILI